MRIEWTLRARASFVRTMNFVRERSPGAAARAYVRVHEAVLQLEQFPDSGRPYPRNPQRRELLVRFGNRGFAILYLVKEQTIVILDFKDQRQDRY